MPAPTNSLVASRTMDGGRAEVIEAGRWLVAERKKRGGDKLCPQGLVASLAQVRASDLGERMKIAQQQISEIERSRDNNEIGPKKGLPHWWRHVVWLFESGEIDNAIRAISSATTIGDRAQVSADGAYLIQSPTGEIVGRILWFDKASSGQ